MVNKDIQCQSTQRIYDKAIVMMMMIIMEIKRCIYSFTPELNAVEKIDAARREELEKNW